ncbi:MAG: ankyrin repeat domain-containing protein [Acidobacteriota bacterium]|nr:ankyrin repeat domain-containing protein [Acidobacteriota bacterium]
MSKKSFDKNLFNITSPCSQDWNTMKGNSEVRFCEHCVLEVNNLSAMKSKDAMRLVRQSEGRICVRYVKNPSNNQPVFADKLYQIANRAPRLAVGAMTATLSFSSMAYAQGGISPSNVSERQTEISQQKDSKKDKVESSTASISGTITDYTGAVIPGVAVSLNIKNDAFNRTVTSNDEGFYEFKNLAAGTYTLKAQGANGFKDHQIEELIISDGGDTQSNMMMEINGETVTVGEIVMVEYELPLVQAVFEEKTEEIKSLLVKGADVNGRDENYGKITALFVAVENGNVETVGTLLDFGAKVNVRDGEKRSPLMRLDSDATPELVRLLVSYGAKVRLTDKEGNNVLHHAAIYVNAEVLQILINEGVDFDAQNKEGQTPLMIAAEYENIECVKALLEADANVNLRDEKGGTALGIAQENGYPKIAELLISYGARE